MPEPTLDWLSNIVDVIEGDDESAIRRMIANVAALDAKQYKIAKKKLREILRNATARSEAATKSIDAILEWLREDEEKAEFSGPKILIMLS